MAKFRVMLNGREQQPITADKFRQDGNYVSFYVSNACTALVRLGDGDLVAAIDGPVTACPDCGYKPGERTTDGERKLVSGETP